MYDFGQDVYAALEARFAEHGLPWRKIHDIVQLKGGQSNPTFRLDTDAGAVVMRMRPSGAPKWAHNIAREYRILGALQETDTLTPRVHHYCDDETLTGGAFYLMDFIEGRIEEDARLHGYAPHERAAIWDSFVDAIATFHQVDYDAIGLADFGKADNYVARQIALHSKLFREYCPEGMTDMSWLMEELPKRTPEQKRTTLVHGDVRMGNMVIHPTEPRIIAILDWEMSTIGDGSADAALLAILHYLPPNPQGYYEDGTDTAALGVPSADEIMARYATQVGLQSYPHFEFYMALNLFRYASVNYGVGLRYRQGVAVSKDAPLYGQTCAPLAACARAILESA